MKQAARDCGRGTKPQLEQILGSLPQWPCARLGYTVPILCRAHPHLAECREFSFTRSGPAASVVLGVTGCGADSNNDDNKTSPFQ